MAKFVISNKTNGDFQFTFKDKNDQIILSSQGYLTKENCKNGINRVKKFSQDNTQFFKITTVDEKFYFQFKGGNGMILATSEIYENLSDRDKAVEFVKTNAESAITIG